MTAGRQSRFCHLCGQPLGQRYFRYPQGLVVCVACERTRPRCARCCVPLADLELPGAAVTAPHSVIRAAGKPPPTAAAPTDVAGAHAGSHAGGPALCRRCRRSARTCACCGQTILTSWYTLEELLLPETARCFCERCIKHRPRCDVCAAPVPPGAATLPDGQLRCALCAASMVLGDDAVREVYRATLAIAGRAAHIQPRRVPDLAIVGRRQMGVVRRRVGTELPAGTDTHHVLGIFAMEGGVATIYVELGLPRPVLLGTLAHELAHAWQVEAGAITPDPLPREGFAEWVAHRVLVASGHRRLADRAAARGDVYGQGLRHFLEIERAAGRRAVLDAARADPDRRATAHG
ncbi:MAG TPA: hypothetical protein VIC85_19050 [Ktedonobacterales bacterium]|jgi:hypothetical protein